MKLVPTAVTVVAVALAVPVLTGYAAGSAATPPVAASFDAATITTLAANGIEQVASARAGAPVAASVSAGEAANAAQEELGGVVRAAVLGPFTDYANTLTHRLAWQLLVTDTVLPSGERGRAWVAVDAADGEVLAARPLLELDAG